MKRKLFLLLLVTLTGIAGSTLFAQKASRVEIIDKPSEKKVDVLVGGNLLTSYIYPGTIKKPVLWPVISPGGNAVTRSYPLAKKEGERVDHPHQVGIWLNYGDVNGLDFWNNSDAIPAEKAKDFGTIRHVYTGKIRNGKHSGELGVTAEWTGNNSELLLTEKTLFRFSANPKLRIIDRTTTLTAVNGDVRFTDNKEGFFAMRVASELEMPSSGKVQLTDVHGNVTTVEKSDPGKVTGNYLSSEGITGEAVWGTRAKWMQLTGVINEEDVTLVMIDHPENTGYPTYWHARGYGLFAANTLGQKALSGGKEELNFTLQKGKSVTFRYRLLIASGKLTPQEIKKFAKNHACCRKSKLISREW